MDDYLDDHEQAEALKRWWQKYGKSVVTGVVLGLIVLFGTRGWLAHRTGQEQAASLVYAQFSQALAAGKTTLARRSGQQLIEQYDRTVYAMLTGLGLAKLQVAGGDIKGAEARLRWVLDHARQPGLVHLARLRLARVLLAEHQPDAALALLNQGKPGAFAAAYANVSGDIYQAKGMVLQAREAYREALIGMPPNAPIRRLVQVKLNELAMASATGSAPSPAAQGRSAGSVGAHTTSVVPVRPHKGAP